MRILIVLIIGTVLLSSCSHKLKNLRPDIIQKKKRVKSGKFLYAEQFDLDDRDILKYNVYKTPKSLTSKKIEVNEKSHKLQLRSFNKKLTPMDSGQSDFKLTDKVYTYPLLNDSSVNLKTSTNRPLLLEVNKERDLYYGDKFIYREVDTKFEALSIPFKYRRSKDSVDYQIATGINIGIAYGIQFNTNKYKPLIGKEKDKHKLIGHKLNKIANTFALFGGFTTIPLTTGNTENLKRDRTIIGLTYGALWNVGINRFNVGVAIGLDTGLSGDAKDWRHQNDPWVGIVVALDFLK
ncbi:MAG: hypothetical protein AAF620_09875 [Bacteroidota bacterium]